MKKPVIIIAVGFVFGIPDTQIAIRNFETHYAHGQFTRASQGGKQFYLIDCKRGVKLWPIESSSRFGIKIADNCACSDKSIFIPEDQITRCTGIAR